MKGTLFSVRTKVTGPRGNRPGSALLLCVTLIFLAASCGRRPPDQRVDLKAQPLPEIPPNDKAFSAYQPAKPYAATDIGVLTRTVFQTDAPSGSRIEVTDWRLPAGKLTTPISLPGAAFIEVRSGTGTVQVGDTKQEVALGSIISASQGLTFTVAAFNQSELNLRLYVVSGTSIPSRR